MIPGFGKEQITIGSAPGTDIRLGGIGHVVEAAVEAQVLDGGELRVDERVMGQEADRGADPEGEVVTSRAPTDSERRDLLFAMKVCRHVKSNAIVIAKDAATRGIGAVGLSQSQMSWWISW